MGIPFEPFRREFFAIMNSEKTKREVFFFLLSISLLFAGGLIYLNFRPHTFFLFSWLKNLNLEFFFEQKSFNSKSKILSFCIYSFPNALWSVSAIILFGLVWKKSKNVDFGWSASNDNLVLTGTNFNFGINSDGYIYLTCPAIKQNLGITYADFFFKK